MFVGIHWSVGARILLASKAFDDGCPGTDRAQDGVGCSMLGDGLVSFVVFLKDEGDGDGLGQMENR